MKVETFVDFDKIFWIVAEAGDLGIFYFRVMMLTQFASLLGVLAVDYSSREVIKSMSPEAYKRLVPPHYDKYEPPVTASEPVIVYFDMKLLDITSVNENDMTFSIESFVTYRWKDWRLRWPYDQAKEKNGITSPCWQSDSYNFTEPFGFNQVCSANYTPQIPKCIVKDKVVKSKRLILDLKVLNDIWQPDAFFKNGVRSSIHEDWVANKYLAFYTNDEHVRLFARMSITLGCHFDFHFYPHDEQRCEMLLQSLSYRSDLVRFEWCENWVPAASKLDDAFTSLPHFTLANYEHIDCSNGQYPCVKAVFLLRRHPDFHILHTYVPTVLIVILSWMSFWINPDATPARVTLGVTSILTMATQYSQSTKNLPPVSYIKSLDIWMITCMVYVFAALLEFSIVYHVYNTYTIKCSSPLCISAQNGNGQGMQLGRDLKMQMTMNKENKIHGNIFHRISRMWQTFFRKATAIDEASRILFPVTYVSFIIGYFSLMISRPEQEALSTHIPN